MTSTTVHDAQSPEETALWKDWQESRSQEARMRLYEHYAPWMRIVAGRHAQQRDPLAEWGDYHHFAALGLLQAIDRHRPQPGLRFKSYAEQYIRGNIRRGIGALREGPKRTPTERVEHHLPVPDREEQALETLMSAAVDLAFGYFLETGLTDNDNPAQQDPYSQWHRKQHIDYLALYVERLPAREKQLIQLHYHDHVPFVDIAREMNITRARVTQLHAQALARIRAWFAEIGERID